MKSLVELREYLGDFAARCQSAKWLGALFHTRVCSDIVADVEAGTKAAAQQANSAEAADAAAVRELEAALEGGLDNSDTERVRRALNLVRQSARRDRRAREILTGSASENFFARPYRGKTKSCYGNRTVGAHPVS